MTYWFFPLPRLIFMFAPLLHIFFDVKLFVSTVEESIAYAATYVIVNAMIQNQLYGHVRWPWMSELYEYVQGVFLIKAIASVIASPRKPTFNVTAKGISLDSDHLSALAWPFLIAFVVLLAGVVTAAWRYAFEPGVNGVMLVVGLWALFNLIIAAAALGVVAERRELRKHPRLKVERRGRVSFDDYTADVEIVNVSAGGCGIRIGAADFIDSPMHSDEARGRLAILGADGHVIMRTLDVVRTRAERDGEEAPPRLEVRTSQAGGPPGARRPHLRGRRGAEAIPHDVANTWASCGGQYCSCDGAHASRSGHSIICSRTASKRWPRAALLPWRKPNRRRRSPRIACPVALIGGPVDFAAEDFVVLSISPEASPTDPDVTINRRQGWGDALDAEQFDRANALYVPRT